MEKRIITLLTILLLFSSMIFVYAQENPEDDLIDDFDDLEEFPEDFMDDLEEFPEDFMDDLEDDELLDQEELSTFANLNWLYIIIAIVIIIIVVFFIIRFLRK